MSTPRGVSECPASLRLLPLVHAGSALSLSPYRTTKVTAHSWSASTQDPSGRARRQRLLVDRRGLSFAAVEAQPGDGG